MQSQIKRVADLDMAFIDEGSGPAILFVHGFPLSHAMWEFQLDAFAGAHRVIAPDLRGYGKSSMEFADPATASLAMETHADDLAALLDALEIEQPVTFCGLSMGGYIAWQFLRRHAARVGKLILCDTRSAPDTPEAQQLRYSLADRVLQFGSTIAASAMIPKMFWRGTIERKSPVVQATRAVIRATAPTTIAAALRGMAQRDGADALLPSIEVPTLLVCGEHDELSTPKEMGSMAERIESAKLVVVPDAGHMAPLENPTVVNDAIRAFLRS